MVRRDLLLAADFENSLTGVDNEAALIFCMWPFNKKEYLLTDDQNKFIEEVIPFWVKMKEAGFIITKDKITRYGKGNIKLELHIKSRK